MWAALHVTQIACRVLLQKCQIPNSFNTIDLIGNSAALVVCSYNSNDLCLNLPDKDHCWLVSVRSKGRRGGDKGKHDTETLVSHQNRPTGLLCYCWVYPNLLSLFGQVGYNKHAMSSHTFKIKDQMPGVWFSYHNYTAGSKHACVPILLLQRLRSVIWNVSLLTVRSL